MDQQCGLGTGSLKGYPAFGLVRRDTWMFAIRAVEDSYLLVDLQTFEPDNFLG